MGQKGDRDWHYARQGSAVGPNSAEEMIVLLRAGVVDRDTLVWHAEHAPEWAALSAHLDLLQKHSAHAAPSPRPSPPKVRPIFLAAAAGAAAVALLFVLLW